MACASRDMYFGLRVCKALEYLPTHLITMNQLIHADHSDTMQIYSLTTVPSCYVIPNFLSEYGIEKQQNARS